MSAYAIFIETLFITRLGNLQIKSNQSSNQINLAIISEVARKKGCVILYLT